MDYLLSLIFLRIYQWDKTSLDDVKTPEMTSSATSITLFNHDDNMVLVMLCSGENNIEVRRFQSLLLPMAFLLGQGYNIEKYEEKY